MPVGATRNSSASAARWVTSTVVTLLRKVTEPRPPKTVICWMLMGFANLMMLPLRVEYLANEKYHPGQVLSVGMIALLTGVIPNLARLVLSPVWGHLFDRVNFFALRATLNVGFAIGILAFFTTNSYWGLIAGAVVTAVPVLIRYIFLQRYIIQNFAMTGLKG